MKPGNLLEVYRAITLWANDQDTLQHVSELLGDTTGKLGDALLLSGVVRKGFRIAENVTIQEAIDCVLLYLAMRKG